MIKTIIFDFGDVFINLDKEATPKALLQLGITWNNEFKELDLAFEKGEISPDEFIETLHNKAPTTTKKELLKAWNAVLLDFPLYRLTFLIELSKTYNLILLSNTDYLHFKHFEEKVGQEFASSFYTCFSQKYFSYELGMRKPEHTIFEYVIKHSQLNPSEILFVDDKDLNTNAAKQLGLHIWQLQVGKEDVIDLYKKLAQIYH